MVTAAANVFPWVEFCAALPDNNIAGNNCLTAIDLNAQAFRFGVTPISSTTTRFFMRHL
jgi:hypothetical protein